jgi:hypothetical protein
MDNEDSVKKEESKTLTLTLADRKEGFWKKEREKMGEGGGYDKESEKIEKKRIKKL